MFGAVFSEVLSCDGCSLRQPAPTITKHDEDYAMLHRLSEEKCDGLMEDPNTRDRLVELPRGIGMTA